MSTSRYRRTKKMINSSQYYRPLVESRGLRRLYQYETPILRRPSLAARRELITTKYVWKYSDKFYKLAGEWYKDSTQWWVIAWYNGYPTDAGITPGSIIFIPHDLDRARQALGV